MTSSMVSVSHRTLQLDGMSVFYREAGPVDAPVVLLPHGYPSSSFQYRAFMAALGDAVHLVAPDLPGFGYSDTPGGFAYNFDGYAGFLARFASALKLERYALYLHDYGAQIGLRLAMSAPERVRALIIQNGDIYEDQLGPRYEPIRRYWEAPTPERRATLVKAVSEHGFRDELVNDVSASVIERISPDTWKLAWSQLDTPARREIMVGLMERLEENLAWFPRYQAYLREQQPPTLIVWGPRDGYMPEGAARAYLRDVPTAELHLIEDGGHWLLESHLDELVALCRTFLVRTCSVAAAGASGSA